MRDGKKICVEGPSNYKLYERKPFGAQKKRSNNVWHNQFTPKNILQFIQNANACDLLAEAKMQWKGPILEDVEFSQ